MQPNPIVRRVRVPALILVRYCPTGVDKCGVKPAAGLTWAPARHTEHRTMESATQTPRNPAVAEDEDVEIIEILLILDGGE